MCSQKVRAAVAAFAIISLSALLVLAGCGGSSPAPTITLSSSTSGTGIIGLDQGQSITITATATNDSGDGVSWTLSGAGTLSSSTTSSVIYTAPSTVTGATVVNITAISLKSSSSTQTITINVEPAPAITTAAGALASGQVGTGNYSVTIATTGGVTPLTFSVVSGALPTGLTLNPSTGTITGTPTVSGTYNFSIKVQDSGTPPLTATVAFTVSIAAAPAINFTTAGALPNATVGTAYSTSVAATGGAGTLTYTLASGALPAGLTLNSNGTITGTLSTPLPGAPDVASFTVKATDIYSDTATSGTLTISSAYPTLNITTSSLPAGIAGTAYTTTTLAATGGNGTYTNWQITGGLTAFNSTGLILDSTTGVISGTPTSVLSSTPITFKLTDTYGDTATATVNLLVYHTLSFTTAATLPNGVISTAYTGSVAATGGSGGYTYTVTGGTGLSEAGLTLNSTGAITGTPTTGEVETAAPVTIKVTDSAGNTASQTFNITVYAGLAFTTAATLPVGEIGTAYTQSVVAVGGSGNYTYTVTGGSGLSTPNLALSTGGAITGSPTTAETAGTVTIKVTDNTTSLTASQQFTLTIYPALGFLTGGGLPPGNVGSSYTDNAVAASGGSGSYTYSVQSGTGLSATGLTYSPTAGSITGTPTGTETNAAVVLKVTDSAGFSATNNETITIYPAITLTGATFASSDVGAGYTASAAATGGSGTFTYALIGSLPGGLSLNANTGAIAGTSTTAVSNDTFSVKATDTTTSNSVTANFGITIYSAIMLTGSTLTSGNVGSTYSASVAATGGSGSYTYSTTSNLDGLSLNANTGAITGTPTATVTGSTIVIKAVDASNGSSTTANYTLTVYSALTFTGTTLPAGGQSSAYSTTVAATGGSGNYSYTVQSGTALSAVGLNLATTGAITGTPTAAESAATVVIKVTDTTTNNSTTATFTLSIYATVTLTGSTLASGNVSDYYSAGVTATGGSGNYTYTLIGSLPASLGLNTSTGAITGTPTAATTGADTFSIKVTDTTTTLTSTANYSITIYGAISYTGTTLTSGNKGSTYSATVATATGGSGNYSYAFQSGTALSAVGLNLATNGAITGTPTAFESAATVVIKVTDTSTGNSTTATFTLTVYSAISLPGGTLASGNVGSNYSASAAATGGSGTYTYTTTSSLDGLSLNANTGAITGTPSATVTASTIAVKATDNATGNSISANYSLTIYSAITYTGRSLAGNLGASFNATASATGGSGNLSYAISGGVLPTGLSLNTGTGAITGTINSGDTTGNYPITIKVTDTTTNNSTTANFPIQLYAAITFTGSTLTSGNVSTAYSASVAASGGSGGGFTYTISSGTALSDGTLALATNGNITGTPTTAEANATVVITATDATTGGTAQATFTLTVYGTLTLASATLPSGNETYSYNNSVAATGGSGNYTYSVQSGTALSAVGLLLNSSTGAITGTPTTTENLATVVIKVTDTTTTNTTTGTFTLTTYAGITFNTRTLPTGNVGSQYSSYVNATGGSSDLSYSVFSGTGLSAVGLSLNNQGTISGTPNATETNAAFTVKVTDVMTGNTATANFTVTVLSALQITSTNIPTATQGTAYSYQFTGTGGSGSYTWSITNGSAALSAHSISLSTGGLLSGTPTGTTTGISYTVLMTDNTTGNQTSAPYTFVINSTAAPQCTNNGSGNALLEAGNRYAFLLAGFDPNGHHFGEIGSFKPSGAGSIGGAFADAIGDQNNSKYSSGEINFTITGTYSMDSATDRGTMSFTNGSNSATGLPATSTFCFVADTVSGGYAESGRIIEADGSGFVLSGFFEIQNTADFSDSALAAGYAFGVEGVSGSSSNRNAAAGQFVLNSSGGVSSGQMDFASFASGSTSYTAASALNTTSSTYTVSTSGSGSGGRGTLTLTTAGGNTLSFITDVVATPTGNKLLMLSTSSSTQPFLVGQAIQQSTTSFTTANAQANSIFRSSGSDAANFTPAEDALQVGQGTFDGAGNFSVSLDSNDGGTIDQGTGSTNGIPNPQTLSANYSVSSLGYVTLTNAGTHAPNFYLYAPGAGFGLDSNQSVNLYTLAAQSTPSGGFTTTYLNSTYFNGSYALGTIPPQSYSSGNYPFVFDDVAEPYDGILNIITDGVSSPGLSNNVTIGQTGSLTYGLDSTYGNSTGRVLFNQGGSLNAIGYVVSPAQMFVMSAQPGNGFIAQADASSANVPNNTSGLTITTPNVNSGTVNQSYSYQLSASGGTGTGYTWSVTSGSGLSSVGLSLSSSGLISGTPTTTESSIPFTVQVTDSNSNTYSATLYMTVVTTGGGYNVGGVITYANFCGGTPTIPPITLTINTNPVQTTTVNSNGGFTFFNVPNGTYTITPSISGPSSIFTPGAQTVTISNSSNTSLNFSATLGYTISGTVTNNSGNTGQIYLALVNSNCGGNSVYGTSISSAGTYTIRGVAPGTYTLNTFIDTSTLKTGQPNANDPSGTLSNITVSTSNITGENITIGTVATTTLSTGPQLQGVSPFNTGAIAQYQALSNNNGVETASSYTLQWSTSSTFGSIAGSKTFPATGTNGSSIWFVNGLTNSTQYYFRAYATSNGTAQSPYSSTVGPITIGANTANPDSGTFVTVSGTISFTGTPTGPLYTGFYSQNTNQVYLEYIANPSNSQSFSISLPTDSSYTQVGILDQDNNGEVSPGDIQNVNGNSNSANITSAESNANLTLPSGLAITQTATQHTRQFPSGNSGSYNDSYGLEIYISGGTKTPVAATLVSGPGVLAPQDLGICSLSGNGGCSQVFEFSPNLATTPAVGNVYTLDVTYSDGSTGTLTGTVSTVLNTFVSSMLPYTGSSTSTTPNFSWSYSGITSPGNYTYGFSISSNSGNIWQIPGNNSNSNGFSDSINSLNWGVDPTNNNNDYTGSPLNTGTNYVWQIQASDSNGDQATTQVNYQP